MLGVIRRQYSIHYTRMEPRTSWHNHLEETIQTLFTKMSREAIASDILCVYQLTSGWILTIQIKLVTEDVEAVAGVHGSGN